MNWNISFFTTQYICADIVDVEGGFNKPLLETAIKHWYDRYHRRIYKNSSQSMFQI